MSWRGLNPRAPDLTRVRIEPGEAFWAVTNGIKFTAMPAFVRMPEDERWQLTAFVTHMAAVTAEQFSQWSTSPREAAVTRAAQAETQNLPAPSVSTGNTESSEIESPPVGENPPRSNPPPSDESEQNP